KYNNYRYGRYEASYAAPIENVGGTAPGNFLANMFTYRTPKWVNWRELDVMLEANITGRVAFNMINADGRTAYPGDKADAGSIAPPGLTSFSIRTPHTYIIEWLPTKVTWYVDGVVINADGGSAAAVPTLSAKIMMNLWVFANAAAFGDPANNRYP